jgi:hypothetical protein
MSDNRNAELLLLGKPVTFCLAYAAGCSDQYMSVLCTQQWLRTGTSAPHCMASRAVTVTHLQWIILRVSSTFMEISCCAFTIQIEQSPIHTTRYCCDYLHGRHVLAKNHQTIIRSPYPLMLELSARSSLKKLAIEKCPPLLCILSATWAQHRAL